MDRRGFLRGLALAVAGAGMDLDIERLLWVPKPMVTVPGLTVPHSFVTAEWMTREALGLLKANLVMARRTIRRYDEADFADFARTTLSVRKPERYR